jgi:hypothetical protein
LAGIHLDFEDRVGIEQLSKTVGGMGCPVGNVLPNGGCKEGWLLTDISQELSVVGQAELLNINSIEQDLSLQGIVKSFDEREDGTLASSGGSDQRHRLAGGDSDGEILENGPSRSTRIGKGNISEFKHSLDLFRTDASGSKGIDLIFGKHRRDGGQCTTCIVHAG